MLPDARVRRDRSTTGQGRKDAGLGKRFGSGVPEGVHAPVFQPLGTGGALREKKAVKPIGGGCQVCAGGADPAEERPAHQERLRPPLRGLPPGAVIGRPERELLLELVEALLADDPAPEHLEDHGARVPPPRVHPRREDADRAFAGRAEVAPDLEVQPDPLDETEHLAPVAAVPLEANPATIIARELAAARMRTHGRTT